MFAVLQDIRAQTKHLYIEEVMAFNYIMCNLATKLNSNHISWLPKIPKVYTF